MIIDGFCNIVLDLEWDRKEVPCTSNFSKEDDGYFVEVDLSEKSSTVVQV